MIRTVFGVGFYRAALLAGAAVAAPALASDVTGVVVEAAQDPAGGGATAGAGGTAAPEEIVVTGARASQLLAIERKRSAPTIIEAVSADLVGKLPDYNPAEALQRLPGVSVQIDQGEARYAVVRGIDPNLNNVTIDGNLVGAPEAEGRRVSLDTIPSELLSAIEVVKAVTPDYDGNAVGGNINIVTPSAFDRRDRTLFASLRGNYSDKADKFGYGGSLTYGTRFGPDDSFGVLAAASYNKRYVSSDTANPVVWAPRASNANTSAPAQYQLYTYDIMRERIGAILNLDWRPSDDLKLYVRNIFNEYTDEEDRDFIDYDFDRGTVTKLSDSVLRFSRGQATRQYRQNNQTQRLYNISPGGEIGFGDFNLALNYTYAYAEEQTPERNDIDTQSPDTLANTIDLSTPRPLFTELVPGFSDPANYRFRRIFFREESIEETLHALKGDLRWDDPFADADGFIKVGVKYTDRDKVRDSRRERFDLGDNVSLAAVGTRPAREYYDGDYPFGPRIDYQAFLDYFAANQGAFVRENAVSLRNDFNVDYDVRERILAGYGMASVELGTLTVTAGARVERTRATYGAFELRDRNGNNVFEASDVAPVERRTNYTDVLPSVHATWRPAEQVQVRAAWTNTIGRPNYDALVPTFDSEAGIGTAGNPDLEPFKSMGLDLTAEYYPAREAIVSGGVFYKKIKNPIFTQVTNNTVFEGVPLLQLTQAQNAEDGYLLGVEANLQYQLAFLPAPFDGFGVSVNGTYVKSDFNVPFRRGENVPFFRQSDWIVNTALSYAKGPFEARIALSYRDDYIESIGANAAADIYNKARTQLDAKVGYDIFDGVQLFGTVSNFNDAPLAFYQGTKDQTFSREFYSWSASFGVSAAF